MNQYIFRIVILILFFCIQGCSSHKNVQKPEVNNRFISGTINYIDLEGGFYGIITDEGIKYNPVNLPEEFKSDRLQVRFTGTPDPKAVSVHMWGVVFRIWDMEVID